MLYAIGGKKWVEFRTSKTPPKRHISTAKRRYITKGERHWEWERARYVCEPDKEVKWQLTHTIFTGGRWKGVRTLSELKRLNFYVSPGEVVMVPADVQKRLGL